jgi:polyhydroxyalkanoate synthase
LTCWNSDSTNLRGTVLRLVFAQYVFWPDQAREENGGFAAKGRSRQARAMPFYLYGSREDHIVPIGGAYASTGQSALSWVHPYITGVINPPKKEAQLLVRR